MTRSISAVAQVALGKTVGQFLNARFRGEDEALSLVAPADDLEQKVGIAVVEREIADLVDDEKALLGVVPETPLERAAGLLPAEVEEHLCGSREEDGVAGDDGLIGDVLRDHGLAETLRGDEYDVTCGTEEVKPDGGLDEGAVDLGGPIPVVVGDGLEGTEMTSRKASLESPPAALAFLNVRYVLENLGRSPALLGGECDDVVEFGSGAVEPESDEAMVERGFTHGVAPSSRARRGGRSHRGGGGGGLAAGGAPTLVKNVSDGRGAERATLVRAPDGDVERDRAVLVEEPEETGSGSTQMSAVEGDLREERFGCGTDGEEAIPAAMLARLALFGGERREVALVFDLLSGVVGAHVAGDLERPIGHTHEGVGGDDQEGLAHVRVGDGVIVSVEPDVGGLSRVDRAYEVGRSRVLWQWQKTEALLDQSIADEATIGI